MKWFRDAVDYLSGVQGRKDRENMEVGIRKQLDDGKRSYQSSWTSSDFGLKSFQQALTLQDKLYGNGDHPEKIETFVWIGKALQKQNELEASMSALKSAFRIQLQNAGLYQSSTAGILNCMMNVLSAMGTPHATKQAQIISNTLFRIKYRLYGKAFDFVDTESSFSMVDTTGIKLSLFEEEHGDHLFRESKRNALAKYKEAALIEYKEFGSHNLNLALLHRKIALSGMSKPTDFPFEARVTPQCQTKVCDFIRQGDELLFQAKYGQATSFYLSAASSKALPQSQISCAFDIVCIMIILFFVVFLFVPGFQRHFIVWMRAKISKTPGCTSRGIERQIVKTKTKSEQSNCMAKTEASPETEIAQGEVANFDTLTNGEASDAPAAGQQILDGEASDSEKNGENQNHEIFSGSFESLGVLLQQSSIVASATEILAAQND